MKRTLEKEMQRNPEVDYHRRMRAEHVYRCIFAVQRAQGMKTIKFGFTYTLHSPVFCLYIWQVK